MHLKKMAIGFLFLFSAGCMQPSNGTSGKIEGPATDRVSLAKVVAGFEAKADGETKTAEMILHMPQGALQELDKKVRKLGGSVQSLSASGNLVKVRLDKALVPEISVPAFVKGVLNSALRLTTNTGSVAKNSEGASHPAQDFFTARKLVGVNALEERMGAADGREEVIAILDTGIDFGLQGIGTTPEGGRKLLGFYDRTDFGRVSVEILTDTIPRPEYQVDEWTLELPERLHVQSVLASGVLTEKGLARTAYVSDGYDLNGNGEFEDRFPFLVGVNEAGQASVWVDLNLNGKIDDAQSEELTDFNSTYDFVLADPLVSPAGGKPLAVSIVDSTQIQFHSVRSGHGTACAAVAAGDRYAAGKLIGMAPKASLLSYIIDAGGQDNFTTEQLLSTFIHAADQGATVISVSWGFATADLASARFIAEILQKEVVDKGVVLVFAAGNEGPVSFSSGGTDYIPSGGYGVAAAVTALQAENLYQWNGVEDDSIIHYSSVGPTQGGRLIPEIAAPLMTLVRGARRNSAGNFYPFGGTSSAAPAFAGAVTSLLSALKGQGYAPVQMRLLKLALLQSAEKISGAELLQNATGMVNVDRAFDLYVQLAKEQAAAESDPTKRTPHPYELQIRTSTSLSNSYSEGIMLFAARDTVEVTVSLSESSQQLVDPLDFVEFVEISHSKDFLSTQEKVFLEATPFRFKVKFDPEKLQEPGVYQDLIELKRTDGLVLARIPVVIWIAETFKTKTAVARVDSTLSLGQNVRKVFEITKPQKLQFNGLVENFHTKGGSVRIQIANKKGLPVHWESLSIQEDYTSLQFQTEKLAPGIYEMVVFSAYRGPAVIGKLKVKGALLREPLLPQGFRYQDGKVLVILKAQRDFQSMAALQTATLKVNSQQQTLKLKKVIDAARPGFRGEIEFSQPTDFMELKLRQDPFDELLEEFRTVALRAHLDGDTLGWDWIHVVDHNYGLGGFGLSQKVSKLSVEAFPNVVNWQNLTTETLFLDVRLPLANPISLATELGEQGVFFADETVVWEFFSEEPLPEGAVVELEVIDLSGKLFQFELN